MTDEQTGNDIDQASNPQSTNRIWGGVAAVVIALLALGAIVAYMTRPASPVSKIKFPPSLTHGSAAGFNVVVITLDTTRADRIGCYGYAKGDTPAIDAFAEEGIRYTDAVTPVPITLPAHTSMFTGLYPPNHGVRNNGEYHVAEEQVTLAELLKGAGYETAAFVAAFVMDARFGLNQGFDVYDDQVDPAKSIKASYPVFERQAATVTDSALAWLRGRESTSPFFMWVHYFDPHQPLRPPEPFKSRHPGRLYDAEIAYMDSQVGRVLKAVEELGEKHRTLYVVVGDHGEGLGDHDETSHGLLTYDATMHVPLILSCPGVFTGSYVVDDVMVSIIDLFPTVIDLLGLPDAPASDAISLLSAHEQGDRMIYMETLMAYLDKGWAPLFAMRRHTDKYILAPRPEYFDLRTDPDELNNLYVNPPGSALESRDMLVAELESRLAQWPTLEEVESAILPSDPETIRRLESLGYVHGASPHAGSAELDPKDMMAVLQKASEANEFTQRGQHKRALKAIEEAIAATPQDPSMHLQKARIYLAMGREPKAEEALRTVISIRPGPQAMTLLAQVLMKDKRFEEADLLLQEVIKSSPGHGAAFIAHGDYARMHGRFREARMAYMYAKQVDPHRSELTVEARLITLDKLEAMRRQRQQQQQQSSEQQESQLQESTPQQQSPP